MIASATQTPNRTSRVTATTGSVTIINGSGEPIYIARNGSSIPFIIPEGCEKTVYSSVPTNATFNVWDFRDSHNLRMCIRRETVAVLAGTKQRLCWNGYRFRNS
jgi:hypothetical protein